MMKETMGNRACFTRSSKWVAACRHPWWWARPAVEVVAKGKEKVGFFGGGERLWMRFVFARVSQWPGAAMVQQSTVHVIS